LIKISIKQFLLLAIAAVLIVFVYFIYPKQQEQYVEDPGTVETDDEDLENTFRDILYHGFDQKGNPFEIGSEYAEIRRGEPDLTYMENVTAYLYYKDRVVVIKSLKAVYNRATNDMLFETDVEIVDGENKAWSDNLDVFASKDYIYIYNNVKFINEKTLGYADKIEIDVASKTSQISMYENKKIKLKFIK